MMKMMSLAMLLATGTASAAIPPYYDSIEKIQAVLAAYPLSKDTASPITIIRALDSLNYEVTAGDCTAQVALEAHPPGMPGKTTYTVRSVSPAKCL